MQGLVLFPVECNHQIADIANKFAEQVGKGTHQRLRVREGAAIGSDHPDSEQHFAGSCAIFSKKESAVTDVQAIDKRVKDHVHRRKLVGIKCFFEAHDHVGYDDDHEHNTDDESVDQFGSGTRPESDVFKSTGNALTFAHLLK